MSRSHNNFNSGANAQLPQNDPSQKIGLKEATISALDFERYYSHELPDIVVRGKEGQACCPFHNDGHPSLSVNVQNGKFFCHACGEKGDVFTFHMLRHDMEFRQALHDLAKRAGVPLRQEVATYDYTDASGKLLYQAVRFDNPKGFCQRRPDGNGGYLYNLNDTALVPYRLPEVVAACTVLIPEGEKDVETLRRFGFVATCNAMGAGKWRAEYNQYFSEKNVVLLPDNDEPGEAHVAEIARNLQPIAASIKVVRLPDLPPKGDVTDWLDQVAGASSEKLQKLIDDSPQWIMEVPPPVVVASAAIRDASHENFRAIKSRIAVTDDPLELIEDIAGGIHNSTLPPSLKHALLKEVAKKTGSTVQAVKQDAAGESDQEPHLQIARRVIAALGDGDLIYAHRQFWQWQHGVWREIDERAVMKAIHRQTQDPAVSKYLVESILDLVKTEVFRELHQFDTGALAINCPNGELHFEDGEWVLKPHDRESFRTSQIPVVYDPAAKAPRFEQFLWEIFDGDPDIEEKANLLCQLYGYSLLPITMYEIFVLLVGSGSNGKSITLDVLLQLAGKVNVAAVQPSRFDDRFQRAHLHGKLINIVTEIAVGAEIHDAQLKAIVSGELTTAEHKHKAPFDFHPFCTCWFGTNHMPHTRDFSYALFRRAIILQFNNTFERNKDLELKKKLQAELPGILNLALACLKDAFNSGKLIACPSCEEAKRGWRLEADQVAQFVEEACTLGPDQKEDSAVVYQRYQRWAFEAGIHRTINRKNFATRLLQLGVELHKGTGGKRMLAGISIQQFPVPGERRCHPTTENVDADDAFY